jgi:hypothetical protein
VDKIQFLVAKGDSLAYNCFHVRRTDIYPAGSSLFFFRCIVDATVLYPISHFIPQIHVVLLLDDNNFMGQYLQYTPNQINNN